MQGYWQKHYDVYDQGRWNHLLEEGRLSAEDAQQMARDVWGKEG